MLWAVRQLLPALLAGTVWDDAIFAEEPAVHAWSGLWNIWFSPADIEREGHYWPIVYTTFRPERPAKAPKADWIR